MSHSSGQDLFTRKARVALDFIVIGASITGLACAYNLLCAGHNVRILEKSSEFTNRSYGLKSPPNMTRLLRRWLGEKWDKVSVKGRGLSFTLGDTGERISAIVFHEQIVQELQAEFRFINYTDLRDLLYDLLLETGVDVEFGSEVVKVDPWHPYVALSTGGVIYGDVIVGADGAFGATRKVVAGVSEKEVSGPYPHFSFSIPTSLFQSDEELGFFAKDSAWNIYMGDGHGVHTHLVRGGEELSGFLIWPSASTSTQPSWTRKIPISSLDFKEYEKKVQKLMSLTTCAVETKQVIQSPLPDWYHRSGKVIILGEAAHLLNPHALQGSALCIEDAAVLGSIFSHIQNYDQVGYFLSVFQELRQHRCETIRVTEAGKTELVTLPNGPLQDARNEGLRKAGGAEALDWEDVSEEYLRQQWEEFRNNFAYDAYDEADTWWVEWGYLNEHASVSMVKEDTRLPLHVQINTAADSEEPFVITNSLQAYDISI